MKVYPHSNASSELELPSIATMTMSPPLLAPLTSPPLIFALVYHNSIRTDALQASKYRENVQNSPEIQRRQDSFRSCRSARIRLLKNGVAARKFDAVSFGQRELVCDSKTPNESCVNVIKFSYCCQL